MKRLLIIFMMLSISLVYSQDERTLKYNKTKGLIEVTYYHENGGISQTGFYTEDGLLHGEWFSYCKKGKKIVSAKYENGNKVGKWFFWNNDSLREVDYSENSIANITEWTISNTTKLASNK